VRELARARRQAPQRLTNGERVALEYQLGSSLPPLPALETSASAPGPTPVDHRERISKSRSGTSPGPVGVRRVGFRRDAVAPHVLMAHQAAVRFPAQPPGSSRQERGRIAPADTLANAY
jgi:hypothetical protein